MKNVHAGNKTLQINEAFLTYSGTHWTTNKGVLLEFLYLGATCDGHALISIFDARTDFCDKPNSAFLSAHKPTLSPKDPAFPAWWEAHKGEWEDAENAQNPDDKYTLDERIEKCEELFAAGKYKEAIQLAGSAHVFVLNDECMGASECGICKYAKMCAKKALLLSTMRRMWFLLITRSA